MTCEILLLENGKQIIAGTVSLNGIKISIDGEQPLMKNILNETHRINGEDVSARQDPKNWFKTLPQHYSGTYMRARIV